MDCTITSTTRKDSKAGCAGMTLVELLMAVGISGLVFAAVAILIFFSGRSYAALALSEGARRIAVGRDGRLHSPDLEAALIEGLTQSGLDVVSVGMGPSPMLYFAVATLGVDGGIQVTGSHNPADYNGFKMLLGGRSVYGEERQRFGRELTRPE